MTIRVATQDAAVRFLFHFGKKKEPKNADAERIFCDEADQYVCVQVESYQELLKLDRMENYITDGRSFHLAVIAPQKTIAAMQREGSVHRFLSKAVRSYWCESEDGTTRLLFGVLMEELEMKKHDEVFIELMDRERQEARQRQAQARNTMPAFPNVTPVQFRRYS